MCFQQNFLKSATQSALGVVLCAVLSYASQSALGAYVPQTYFRAVECPVPNDTLYATITLPVNSSQSDGVKFPLVLFINGFVLRSCVYAPYANLLASHGYAVLQYDDGKNPLSDFQQTFDDSMRVDWINSVLDCVKKAAAFADNMDFETISVVGHSRGAKLAGLYYAENYATMPALKAAYLIDPIDSPKNASEKCISFFPNFDPVKFPNLADVLKEDKVPALGISAAALTSKCNCNSSNYQELWPAAASGSWLTVISQSGHLQVTDDSLAACTGESWWVRAMLKTVYVNPGRVPGIGKYLAQWTCAKGNITSVDAIDLAATPMLAWLEATVKGKPLSTFQSWVEQQQKKGALEFSIKKGDAQQESHPLQAV